MTESVPGGGNPRGGDGEQGPPSSARLLPAPAALSPSRLGRPFVSAQLAVKFGLSYSRSPVSTSLWTNGVGGADASGDEALAQAGMVVAALKAIGPTRVAILTARVLPHSELCGCGQPCCVGRRPNFEWRRALETVAREGFAAIRVSIHPSLARAIATRAYARGPSDAKVAEQFMTSVDSVSDAARQFRRWLMGGRGEQGAEPDAWRRADERLRSLGVVADD